VSGTEDERQRDLQIVRQDDGPCHRRGDETNGLVLEDISLLVPHQANLRIINAIRVAAFSRMKRYTRTSTGTATLRRFHPDSLDEAVRGG
jgi:3-oxoacyl-[acyl-carrier-protein] synthase III